MSDPFYVSKARVHRVAGVHRRAHLEDGTTLEMGVHGAVRDHYGLETQANLPLPVDYLIAAAAG